MVKLNINQSIFLSVIGLLLITFLSVSIYNSFREKKIDNSQEKIEEIRKQKDIEIAKKQKEIDSVLVDLEKNRQRIIFLTGKIDIVNNDIKNLEKQLEKTKSDIKKMSNDEIIKYWEYEFEK
jgi:peptidoglycan hydrolase CwlO-like protein